MRFLALFLIAVAVLLPGCAHRRKARVVSPPTRITVPARQHVVTGPSDTWVKLEPGVYERCFENRYFVFYKTSGGEVTVKGQSELGNCQGGIGFLKAKNSYWIFYEPTVAKKDDFTKYLEKLLNGDTDDIDRGVLSVINPKQVAEWKVEHAALPATGSGKG